MRKSDQTKKHTRGWPNGTELGQAKRTEKGRPIRIIEPPTDDALLADFRADYRERLSMFLLAIARYGKNTSLDYADIGSARVVRRFVDALELAGLLHTMLLRVPASAISLRAFWLSETGKDFAMRRNVQPVESDLERLLRLHQAAQQDRHTALILLTAFHARQRGGIVETVPFDPSQTPNFQPDLKITEPDGREVFVECETHSRVKQHKWSRMREVNLVVPTFLVRVQMVARLRLSGLHGRATDLTALREGGEFWAQSF